MPDTDREIDAIADKIVPPEVAQAIQDAFRRIGAETREFDDVYTDDDGLKVEPIPAISYPGFWAWTNGGFQVTCRGLISYAVGEKYPAAADFLVRQYEDLDEDTLGDEFEASQEAYDGFYRYEFRAVVYLASNWRNPTEPKVDQITFRAGINPYDPGEQGEKTTWYFERVVPLADLTPEKVHQIEKAIVMALRMERGEGVVARPLFAVKSEDTRERIKESAERLAASLSRNFGVGWSAVLKPDGYQVMPVAEIAEAAQAA